MPGTTHTQWWSQLIGEIRSPVRAVISTASISCPARYSSAAAARPNTATTTARTSHGTVAPGTLPASRMIKPRSDWLPPQPGNPLRPSRMNSPLNQNSAELDGVAAKPTATVPAKPASARKACRNLRVSSR
jgi:hypothetical protein